MTEQSILRFPDSDYVRQIVGRHLDPLGGTPYWLEEDGQRGGKALHGVTDFATFKRLVGFRDREAQRRFEQGTRFRAIENFIPQSLAGDDRWVWVSQTGGTTGPHTTGRLVIALTERRGGRCFSIDLDPRIVKIFGEEGMANAQARYVQHIWEQVEPIIRFQSIGVLFATSRLLEMLPGRLAVDLFRNVQAVVHAGTTMERDSYRILREDVFPGTPIVGIYGTSTTGISFQKLPEEEDQYRVVYIPSSPYIVLEIVDDQGTLVDYGEEGNVATYRLTDDYLIPGFWERDRARRVTAYGRLAQRYPWDWISDVYSPQFTIEGRVEGVY